MIILGVLGLALAAYSAAIVTGLFRTLWRAQGLEEPNRLAATTGLVMVGWLLSAAVGMALTTFALTSQIST
jgi:hypothetical protein